MAIRTRLNARYIRDELVWHCRLTLNELNEQAGLSGGYIYRLLSDDGDSGLTVGTVDRLYNAISSRLTELNKNVPDDLWSRLIEHVVI